MGSRFRRRHGAWVALAAALPLLAAPAAADSVISYSAPEGAYGWCAGYSNNRARSCAEKWCLESGGTACEPVVECGDGWGAVSFAQAPASGFAAVCGMGSAAAARIWALTRCAALSRTLCWTDTTFDRSGSKSSAASNLAFDMTLYAQVMLQVRHYELGDADGQPGPRTRAAIAKFESDIGLAPQGEVTAEVLDRLVDAVGGATHLAWILNRDVVEPRKDEDYGYVTSSAPAPELSISEEAAALPEPQRLVRLATMLAASGDPCAIPAKSAERPFDDGDMWLVECAEQSYTLILNPDGSRVIMSGTASTEEATEDAAHGATETGPTQGAAAAGATESQGEGATGGDASSGSRGRAPGAQ